jgi:VWFA-related protein
MSPAEIGALIRVNVTYVEVPVTVKDSKGREVPGLEWRDFRVFENNNYEPLKVFTTDSYPLSIAFVVDQSLPRDIMEEVNTSLNAIQGALTPYDELAVFTYGNGAHNQSGGFTGAQSARVPFILSMTKAAGTEQLNAVNSGPFASCGIYENGNCIDPNLQAGKSAGSGYFMTIPKEIHTLNDAILMAARELSTRPKGRRRIIYVISDGKEYGSKAKYADVVKVLQTNHIMVYGTLLGDAARWGEGRLSRIHLPFTMYDNRLVGYVLATGGTMDSEHSVNNIEKSYTDLAREARTRYTLVYASHEPLIDGKFRSVDVRVNRPNLEVTAPRGYYPSASDADTH